MLILTASLCHVEINHVQYLRPVTYALLPDPQEMQRTGIIRNLWSLEGVGENVIIIHVHMAFPCLAKRIS